MPHGQVHAQTYYTYTLHGPYYDDGSVVNNGQMGVTVLYANDSITRFWMNNTGLAVNTTVIVSTNQAVQILWTSGIANVSRVYYFLSNATTDEVYLHVVSSQVPAFVYTFNIADLVGMRNPYLQTSISNGSMNQAVERQSIGGIGIASFVMAQYGTYTLTFICDQGTMSQSFIAETTFSVNLQVLAGAFPTSFTNQSAASATRLNSTAIQINYTDPDAATTWIYVAITHQVGATTIIDYTDNQTANSYTTTATVDNQTDYYVQIQALRYNQVTQWNFVCPAPLTSTNPFTGLLDFLGSWPPGIDPAQLIGAAIIMVFLCIGSFRSAGVSCVLAWIAMGILMAMGWFSAGVPMFAFAGVFSIIVVIDEGKSTTRDA